MLVPTRERLSRPRDPTLNQVIERASKSQLSVGESLFDAARCVRPDLSARRAYAAAKSISTFASTPAAGDGMSAKRSRCRALHVVGIGVAVAHAVAGAEPTVGVPKWADDFLAAWYHAYNAGNAEAVSSFFEQDATLGEDRGRRAIAASLTRAFSSASYQCQGHFEAFRQVGNTAVAWGIDACVQTSKATAVTTRTKERWLAVFEQQASGKWLVSRQTWEELKP